jgi:lipid A 3-O-deacylase
MKRIAAAAVALVLTLGGVVQAQDFGINEIRGGIMAHSWDETGPGGAAIDLSRIQDLNLEVLFTPLPTADWFPGMIRPNIGTTINFGGLESTVYGGLSWKLPVFSTPFFLEGGLGASLNDGAQDGATFPARDLGCALLFHEQASVGYDLTQNVDVMLTAEHSSSANLCTPNRGLSNVGIRIGWKF